MRKDIIRDGDDFFREQDLVPYGGDVQVAREMNRWIEPITRKNPQLNIDERQSAIFGLMAALEQMAEAGVFEGLSAEEQKRLARESLESLAEDNLFEKELHQHQALLGGDPCKFIAKKVATAFTMRSFKQFPNHPFFEQFKS